MSLPIKPAVFYVVKSAKDLWFQAKDREIGASGHWPDKWTPYLTEAKVCTKAKAEAIITYLTSRSHYPRSSYDLVSLTVGSIVVVDPPAKKPSWPRPMSIHDVSLLGVLSMGHGLPRWKQKEVIGLLDTPFAKKVGKALCGQPASKLARECADAYLKWAGTLILNGGRLAAVSKTKKRKL